MPVGSSWVRVKGDGRAVEGPCLLHDIVFWPDANGDYVDIYDGLDATAGKKFCRIESVVQVTWQMAFDPPVEFFAGIYCDGIDSAVETTIVFSQVE